MDDAESKNLNEISRKIDITDREIINKASEHLRLLKVKSRNVQISEYAKIVICLDVASTNANGTFNPVALTLLNYGKAKYRKERNIIERILNVTKIPDVKHICSSLRVANNKDLEENSARILSEYKKGKQVTVSHPQYDAMAVYHTSKMMKIKVSENKLIEISHLKRIQWTNLKNQWQRWLEDNKIDLKRKPKEMDQENVTTDTQRDCKRKHPIEEKKETHEQWKKRILDKAYADLKAKQNIQN